ncbi:MBL fold metallo-hydrolase [Thermoanaerobacterium thermosaccharolyticum]|uniref:MBL fold metallo-hydrolase n=1 Tax=Thermoanaerobacterium thermosaccharolyticum TaxID=1517 RepID=UPI003D2894F1
MIDIKVLASGSKGNCYRVTDSITLLIIEAGIPYKEIQRKLNFKISEIAACLITHEHKDHCKAVKDVIKAGIDCYMTQGTKEAIELDGHRIKVIKPKQQFKVGSWTILPFETQHDAVEPVGFLLANQAGEKLLYATDTYYIKYRFKNLTHIMVECNYSISILKDNVEKGIIEAELKNRLFRSHFSLENVKEFFKANDLSKVKQIWLLHLSDNNSDAERFKREIQELTGKEVYIAEG